MQLLPPPGPLHIPAEPLPEGQAERTSEDIGHAMAGDWARREAHDLALERQGSLQGTDPLPRRQEGTNALIRQRDPQGCGCLRCRGMLQLVGERPFASGAQGEVWECTCDFVPCAVKILLGRYAEQKAQGLKTDDTLRHPNLVSYMHVFTCHAGDPRVHIVMPFYPGGDLRDEKLTPREVKSVVLQMAEALSHLHSKGYIHQDLKPGNILRVSPEEYKLADFDVVVEIGDNTRVTSEGMTYIYSSNGMLTGRVGSKGDDIWCLGATALVLLKGKEPEKAFAYLRNQQGEEFPQMMANWVAGDSEAPEEGFDGLMEVVMAMLREKEGDRPTAQEIVDHIQEDIPLPTPSAEPTSAPEEMTDGGEWAASLLLFLAFACLLLAWAKPGAAPAAAHPQIDVQELFKAGGEAGEQMGENLKQDFLQLKENTLNLINTKGKKVGAKVREAWDHFEEQNILQTPRDGAEQAGQKNGAQIPEVQDKTHEVVQQVVQEVADVLEPGLKDFVAGINTIEKGLEKSFLAARDEIGDHLFGRKKKNN